MNPMSRIFVEISFKAIVERCETVFCAGMSVLGLNKGDIKDLIGWS